MSDIVKYEQQDAVAVITLNRPDNMNAFTNELRADLLQALTRATKDDDVRAVVLTGEGRCFSAGADLKDDVIDRPISEKLQQEYRPVQEAIAEIPKPIIAAVPGSAAGIGLSVALQCDLLIMADNAFMLSPFTTISLVPDGGLNWALVRQLGYRRAFQLSVESERIPADRCVELGLANRAVPAAELQTAALEYNSAPTARHHSWPHGGGLTSNCVVLGAGLPVLMGVWCASTQWLRSYGLGNRLYVVDEL